MLISNCRKSGSETIENWSGGLITKPGTYEPVGTKNTITVWIDEEQLVRYSIANAGGKVVIASTERPSVYSNWFAYFDFNGWLWFESGDIGVSVLRKDEDGIYEEIPIIDQEDLIRAMPEEFFKRLPQSTEKMEAISNLRANTDRK
ncbi:MAG: hypothetical protein R3F23_07620 [Verrucomicrobiia bacterium]